jgi:hypothetical protein
VPQHPELRSFLDQSNADVEALSAVAQQPGFEQRGGQDSRDSAVHEGPKDELPWQVVGVVVLDRPLDPRDRYNEAAEQYDRRKKDGVLGGKGH